MNIIDTLGWVATALLIGSVSQTHMVRLRVLSFAASIVWVIYAVMLNAVPLAATNIIIALMNVWQIWKIVAANKNVDNHSEMSTKVDCTCGH